MTLGVCGLDTFDERGLLGVAFHPNYQQNGLLYTYTSEPTRHRPHPSDYPDGAIHPTTRTWSPSGGCSTWAACRRCVDPASRRELMRVNWPQFNHDGGDLAFGPDGKLYISMGDGGGADDADGQLFTSPGPRSRKTPTAPEAPIIGHQGNGNAQKLNMPLGKILRIDVNPPFTSGKEYGVPADNPFVNRPDALGEIWAFGFRNPFRFSFDQSKRSRSSSATSDRTTSRKWTSSSAAATTAGTARKERSSSTSTAACRTIGFASRDRDPSRTDCTIPQRPDRAVRHPPRGPLGHGRVRVSRPRDPELRGKYVFGDFSVLFKFPTGPHDYGRLFVIDPDREGSMTVRKISQLLVLPGGALSLALLGWGQDARGELYPLGNISGLPFPRPDLPVRCTTGRVIRLVPAPKTAAIKTTTAAIKMTTTAAIGTRRLTDVPATRIAPCRLPHPAGPAGAVRPRTMGETAMKLGISALLVAVAPGLAIAGFDDIVKARARITSCTDGTFVGTALLVERPSAEDVKVVDVFVTARGLTPGKHAVHIHEVGNCTPCSAAGSHLDLGPYGHNNPVTDNHPYHSGDLVNIEIRSRGTGSMSTTTNRIALSPDSPGPTFGTQPQHLRRRRQLDHHPCDARPLLPRPGRC